MVAADAAAAALVVVVAELEPDVAAVDTAAVAAGIDLAVDTVAAAVVAKKICHYRIIT